MQDDLSFCPNAAAGGAICVGGKWIADYDGERNQLYDQAGFVAVSRTRFEAKEAPEGWDTETAGTPNLVFWVKSPTGEVVDQKLAIDELPGDVDYEIAKSYAFVMMEEFDKVKEQSLDKRSPNDIISVETLQKKVLTRITSRFQRRYAKYRPELPRTNRSHKYE